MNQLISCQCTQSQLESPDFRKWVERLKDQPDRLHRKLWEFCYIAQALYERGMLRPGLRGLGFGVGKEPLPALFASYGCNVVATDQSTELAMKKGWVDSGQHTASLDGLNIQGICPDELFRQRVVFRVLNMRSLPDNMGEFDFLWSSCSLEHLGTLARGEKFIYESLKYLKAGGVAVHTTEYNVNSNFLTLSRGGTVLYRKKDLKRIADKIRKLGYKVSLDFTEGDMPADKMPDKPPYKQKVHLKLYYHGIFVITSFGLIIEKPKLS